MSALRSIRLLNSVEAALTDSTELQTILSNTGRLSEFSVLMSMRGQARRMASSSVTIETFINTPLAINQIFSYTDKNNPTLARAIFDKQNAMVLIVADRNTLTIIMQNPTSALLLQGSQWFETYMKEILTGLTSSLVSTDYADIQTLVTDNAAMGVVLSLSGAVKNIVASPATMSYIAPDLTIMGILVDSSSAITLCAADSGTVNVFAGQPNSMTAIAGSAIAMPVITGSAIAMPIMGSVGSAFNALLGSSYFAANRKNALANLLGLDPSAYLDVSAMVDSTVALTAIAANANAVTIFAGDSAATSYLATSPNVGIILSSGVAMAVLGASESVMLDLIASVPTATLFSSSIAKSYMFTDNIVATIAGNSGIMAYMLAASSVSIPASLRSSTTASDDPFDGIPSKVFVLKMRANNIGAIDATFSFNGSTVAGTNPGTSDVGLRGSAHVSTATAYIDPTWTVAGIAVTAAVSPEWTYFDMT